MKLKGNWEKTILFGICWFRSNFMVGSRKILHFQKLQSTKISVDMCNSSHNFDFFSFAHLTRLLNLYMIVFLWLLLQPKVVFIVNLVNNILDNSLEMHWLRRNQLPLATNKHIAVWNRETFIHQMCKYKAPMTQNISDLSYWTHNGHKKICALDY